MAMNAWAAPTTSKAWAEQVEEEEAQNGGTLEDPAFPSLSEAAKKPENKKGRKKGTTLTLNQLYTTVGEDKLSKTDKEIRANLPTGSKGYPKDAAGPGSLGGGFKEYGGNRGFRNRGDDDGDRPPRRMDEPSRADQTDDWGSTRKFQPSDARSGGSRDGFGSGEGRREGSFRREGGFGGGPSVADQVDDWGSNRKFQSSDSFGGRDGSSSGGFRDRRGFDDRPPRGLDDRPRVEADDRDWSARKSLPPEPQANDRPSYAFRDPRGGDTDRWGRGEQRPLDGSSERPRLNLKPRSQKSEEGVTSSSPSAPQSEGSQGEEAKQSTVPKPRKSNPFGDARPREEVLKEKGIDYIKEELKYEHGEVIREKTPEELKMEGDIDALKKRLAAAQELEEEETDDQKHMKEQLSELEDQYHRLATELDDKVRFSRDLPPRAASQEGPPPGSEGGDWQERPRGRRGPGEGFEWERKNSGGERFGGRDRDFSGDRRDRGAPRGDGFGDSRGSSRRSGW